MIASVSSFTAATMAREYHVPLAKFSLLPSAVDPLKFPLDANIRETAPLTITTAQVETRDIIPINSIDHFETPMLWTITSISTPSSPSVPLAYDWLAHSV